MHPVNVEKTPIAWSHARFLPFIQSCLTVWLGGSEASSSRSESSLAQRKPLKSTVDALLHLQLALLAFFLALSTFRTVEHEHPTAYIIMDRTEGTERLQWKFGFFSLRRQAVAAMELYKDVSQRGN